MHILPNYAYYRIITQFTSITLFMQLFRHPLYYYTHPLRNVYYNVNYANFVNYAVGTRPLSGTGVGCQLRNWHNFLFTPIIDGLSKIYIIMQITQIMPVWLPRLQLRPEH